MNIHFVRHCVAAVFAIAGLIVIVDSNSTGGQEKPAPQEKPGGKSAAAWTLEEAMGQLQLNPKDPFLQYVVLQLARRENRLNEVADAIERFATADREEMFGGEDRRVDLLSIFSGALAVQESLQLSSMRVEARSPRRVDRMPPQAKKMDGRPGGRIARAADAKRRQEEREAEQKRLQQEREAEQKRRERNHPIERLTGPTIKSHPWQAMLAGKKPEISPLAMYVPEDCYFVEFRSLNKLIDSIDLSNLWSSYFFNQGTKEARTHRTGERVKAQLAIETNRLLRPVYDLIVQEVAVAGSDLFVNEGSDVTLLFRIKEPIVFKARMDQFLANAEKSHPDAKRTSGEYHGVTYVHIGSKDRSVHVFSAYPRADLHVRSNSLAAFQRIIDSIVQQPGDQRQVRRLGETEEFAYIRTLMPRGAPEEDGFIYLSDPFIRRLMGPVVKVTELRRMMCYNHLRMIGHAALLYQAEHGKTPDSLAAIAQAQCSPGIFGKEELACPDGGTYSLSADGLHGVCSHHGHAHYMTPCCDIAVSLVSDDEAGIYESFVQEYNQYWRTFFDPIAIRLQVSPERYRLETIVLPLIDNSIYTGLAQVLGGKPEPLDALPVPKRNIFSVAVRLNKRELLKQSGLEDTLAPPEEPKAELKSGEQNRQSPTSLDRACAANLRQIALALHNYHDANRKFPAVANFDKTGKPLLSWRVHILPYLEQYDLYQQFHLDEPWDSEHNKKLIPLMPAVYRCAGAKFKEKGQTTYLAPVGKSAMFTGTPQQIGISDVTDGTSNTIFIVDAADDRAVTWTKPDDLRFDAGKPLAGLVGHHQQVFAVSFVDGTVHLICDTIAPETLNALLSRNGGEIIQYEEPRRRARPQPAQKPVAKVHDAVPPFEEIPLQSTFEPRVMNLPEDIVNRLKLQEFLWRGIGNQISLHTYDSVQFFDLNLPAALGMAAGTLNGRMREYELIGAAVAASINSPTYIAVPIQDAKIVDEFLSRLDSVAQDLIINQRGMRMFVPVGTELYFSQDKPKSIRTIVIQYGPVKWRFFWARIGAGLYIASKRFILEDLMALQDVPSKNDVATGHAMIRIRPKNWDLVLKDFRLAWAENNREACLNNLGPLTSVTRALKASTGRDGQVESRVPASVERLLGAHFFCPENGHYVVSADGKKVHCTVHGDRRDPRQPTAPANDSPPNRLLQNFTDMNVTLTFLEDGLHAVATIDRKK
jgi:hypothetical protein